MYFKRVKEGRVPPAVYREIALANIKGYNVKDGLKMLTFECRDKEWLKMAKLWEHLDTSKELRKIIRMAFVQPAIKKKPLMDDVITHNRNLGKHVEYACNLGYTSNHGINNTEKLVEV